MSSKNARIATMAKRTSATVVQLLSRALRAFSRTWERLLRGVGHLDRPPQHTFEQAHQGIDGKRLQQERSRHELIHPTLHRADSGHHDDLGCGCDAGCTRTM